jgi:hypothetical protein
MKRLLFVILILSITSVCDAKLFCVDQTAGGTCTGGTVCTDAASHCEHFSDAVNSASLASGDVIELTAADVDDTEAVLDVDNITIKSTVGEQNQVTAAAGKYALKITDATNVSIENISFVANDATGTYEAIGIIMTNASESAFINITGCNFSGDWGGVKVSGAHATTTILPYVTINNCFFTVATYSDGASLGIPGTMAISNSGFSIGATAAGVTNYTGSITLNKCYFTQTANGAKSFGVIGNMVESTLSNCLFSSGNNNNFAGVYIDGDLTGIINVVGNVFLRNFDKNVSMLEPTNGNGQIWNIKNNTFYNSAAVAVGTAHGAINLTASGTLSVKNVTNNIFYNFLNDYYCGGDTDKTIETQSNNTHYHPTIGRVSDNNGDPTELEELTIASTGYRLTDPTFYSTAAPTTGLWLKSIQGVIANPHLTGLSTGLTAPNNYLLGRNTVWKTAINQFPAAAGSIAYVATMPVGTGYEVPTVPRGAYADQRKFYVATAGNNNDAGTLNTPVSTIAKLVALTVDPGDYGYLKKGSTFTETLTVPASGTAGNVITYGAYGTGAKPVISNYYDLSATGSWTDYGATLAHTWYATALDVGTLSYGSDTILTGKKITWDTNLTTTIGTTDGNFYHDAADEVGNGVVVYVHSTANPATAYSGLKGWYKISTVADSSGGAIYILGKDFITVDGLAVKYAGGHGIQVTSGSDNVIVKNCDVSYVGGSHLTAALRFGNGIEVYGAADTVLVDNNTLSYCFDEGITSQGGAVTQEDITFSNNTIDRCGRGGAFTSAAGATITNVLVTNNSFTNNGAAPWIPTVSNGQGLGVLLGTTGATNTNCVFTKNYIADNPTTGADPIGQGIRLSVNEWTVSYNKVVNTRNSSIRSIGGTGDIYGNIVINSSNAGYSYPALYTSTSAIHNIYNNTFAINNDLRPAVQIGVSAAAGATVFKNNIIANVSGATSATQLLSTGAGQDLTSDYNCCCIVD